MAARGNTRKANKTTLERKLKRLQPDYRAYVTAQIARAQAPSKAAATRAQRTMDSLRPSYTEYRRVYNALRKAQAK